jgi:hypothetical protein
MLRMPGSTLRKVFSRRFTLDPLAAKRLKIALPAYKDRFRQTLRRFVARPGPQKNP